MQYTQAMDMDLRQQLYAIYNGPIPGDMRPAPSPQAIRAGLAAQLRRYLHRVRTLRRRGISPALTDLAARILQIRLHLSRPVV